MRINDFRLAKINRISKNVAKIWWTSCMSNDRQGMRNRVLVIGPMVQNYFEKTNYDTRHLVPNFSKYLLPKLTVP